MPEDDWGTDQPRLSDATIDEVLARGEPEEDRKELGIYRTTVRTVPLGLVSAVKKLALLNRLRVSQVQRLCTRHGLALILDDRRYTALSSSVRSVLNGLKEQDQTIIAMLESRRHLAPIYSRGEKLNIGMYTIMQENIADLSYNLGLFGGSIIVYICLMSLNTSTKIPELSATFGREMDRFWSNLAGRQGEMR